MAAARPPSKSPALWAAAWLRNSNTQNRGWGWGMVIEANIKPGAPVPKGTPLLAMVLLVEALSSWYPTPLLSTEDTENAGQTETEREIDRARERQRPEGLGDERGREVKGWGGGGLL